MWEIITRWKLKCSSLMEVNRPANRVRKKTQQKPPGNRFFVSYQIWWMINIIDIPLFALFWVRIQVYLYLGPSEIYSFHIIHLDLSILRHFKKQNCNTLVRWKNSTSEDRLRQQEEATTMPRRGSLTMIFECVMQKFNEAFVENLPSDELKELPPKCEILSIDA